MRREKTKNKSFIKYLVIIASFTLLSFLFDQLVIQKENQIRKINTQKINARIKINEGLFLINSIFDISKTTAFSQQVKKNSLDQIYLRESTFKYPDNFGKENKHKILISGVDGFAKHKLFHEKLYIELLENHNKTNNLLKFYISNFKNNDIFNNVINNHDEPLVREYIKDVNKMNFTKEEISQLKKYFKIRSYENDHGTLEDPEYKFYANAREKMNNLSYLADLLYLISDDIIDLYFNDMQKYEEALFVYSESKNDKNLFILLSILFQILGLTALMFLFKVIINDDE